jgi:hypothetical protein
MYCQDCYDERYASCEDCGDVCSTDDLYGPDNQYCRNCYSDHYTTCYSCDEEIHIDNAHCFNDHDYCEECLPQRRENLHEYDYKPDLDFYRELDEMRIGKKTIYLGVELECDEGDDLDIVDVLSQKPQLYCKQDGSLNNGFEVVSHPMTLKYHQGFKWQSVLDDIKNHGYKSYKTDTCGLHVHISRNALTMSQQVKLAMLVYTNPEYFQKLAQRTNSFGKFKKLDNMRETINGTRYNQDRFEAINFQNSKTIEFRMFKGTLCHSTFMATIELVHALVAFVSTVKTSDVYKKNMFSSDFRNGKAYRKFCIFVSNSKEYKYLVSYMKKREVFITL